MTISNFYDRLNQIESRLSSPDLIANSGLGNEIGFYVFDYPVEFELKVRNHLDTILPKLNRRVAKIDLFRLLIDYLQKRNILDAAIELQKRKGDEEMFRALKGSLDEDKRIAPEIMGIVDASQSELVVIVGVGSVYPLLRTHRLRNCLQPLIKNIPLIVFYPGDYNGQSLSLFSRLSDDNYYRAFRLV